jgi:hypothetical protein
VSDSGTAFSQNHKNYCACEQTGFILLDVQSSIDRLQIASEGDCGRPYKYTIKMEGRQVGKAVMFKGTVDLGKNDGGYSIGSGAPTTKSSSASLPARFIPGRSIYQRRNEWEVAVVYCPQCAAQLVDSDKFCFFETEEMKTYLTQAGFELEEVIERDPYPDIEAQTRRAYVFARNP